jgi:hypothetical protein
MAVVYVQKRSHCTLQAAPRHAKEPGSLAPPQDSLRRQRKNLASTGQRNGRRRHPPRPRNKRQQRRSRRVRTLLDARPFDVAGFLLCRGKVFTGRPPGGVSELLCPRRPIAEMTISRSNKVRCTTFLVILSNHISATKPNTGVAHASETVVSHQVTPHKCSRPGRISTANI